MWPVDVSECQEPWLIDERARQVDVRECQEPWPIDTRADQTDLGECQAADAMSKEGAGQRKPVTESST